MNTAPVQVAAKCHQPASPHFWSANGCSTPLVGPLRAVPPTWSAPSGLFHPPGRPPQGCSTHLVSHSCSNPLVGPLRAVPPPWSAPSGLFHPPGQPKAVPPQGRPKAVPPQGQPKAVPPQVGQRLFHHLVSQKLFHHLVSQRLFHPPRSATAVPPYLLHRLLHRQPAQVTATPQSSTSQSVLAVTACMHAPVWLQE